MMYLREDLNIGYIGDLKTQILELPYAGDVSMFLLLPDEIGSMSTGLELVSCSNLYCFKPLELNLPSMINMSAPLEAVCSFSQKHISWLVTNAHISNFHSEH